MKKLKCVLYINQFFAQIGGEEKADYEPEIRDGVVGPGLFYNHVLGDNGEIVNTVICGDNFMGSNTKEATEKILAMLEDVDFDVFLAGPAFRAGRYGVACGTIAKAVQEKFNVPAFTSMNDENPGVEMFRKHMVIFKGGASAAAMKSDVSKIVSYAVRSLNDEKVLWADAEGYFGRGIRHQVFPENEVMAADRAVDMLLARIDNKPFTTELVIEDIEKIEPAQPIANLKTAKIALLNTGGIIPVDNPDKIQSASATRWGKYDISNCDKLLGGEYKTIHAGFDPTEADKNPNIVAPVDVLKQFEKEGFIGEFYNYFYTTVGTGTTQSDASRMAEEIYEQLKADDIDGVIMVST